jgi:hypothetical protein
VFKGLLKVPEKVQIKADLLFQTLRLGGPTAPFNWPNYGKLKAMGDKYHCHLTGDHKWVACWEFDLDTIIIEVYYVGSHQDAPY